jgi:hypothetical protein
MSGAADQARHEQRQDQRRIVAERHLAMRGDEGD